jgi:hypothetical protein
MRRYSRTFNLPFYPSSTLAHALFTHQMTFQEKKRLCGPLVPKNKKLVTAHKGRLPVKLFIMAKCPW